MSTNIYQITDLLAKNSLVDYTNSLGMTMCAQNYDKFDYNPNIGTTIRELYPLRLDVIDSLSYNPTTDINPIVDRYQNIALNLEESVPFDITAQQMSFFSKTSGYDEFSDRYINSSAVAMANRLNSRVIGVCEYYWTDSVGDPTQNAAGINSLAVIQTQFANMGLQMKYGKESLFAALSPNAYNNLQIPYATYFNEEVNLPILKNGVAGFQYGVNIFQDFFMRQHTTGTFDAPALVQVDVTIPNGESINGAYSTVSLKGFTPSATGVLTVGDLVWFGTQSDVVNSVNPISYTPYPNRKTFFVISDGNGSAQIDADGAGDVTIRVYPPIVSSAITAVIKTPYTNVSRQVVENDVVNLIGGASSTYRKNFCFAREGFFVANPEIATFPLPPSPASHELRAFPGEVVKSMMIPGNNLKVAINLATQGSLSAFSNSFAMRTIAGVLPFNGYGFCYLTVA